MNLKREVIDVKDDIIKLYKERNREISLLNAKTLSSGIKLNWFEVHRIRKNIKKFNDVIEQKQIFLLKKMEQVYPKPNAISETKKFIRTWENA
ncbi:hypothetical protein HN777_04670 [Candidatus Woesearchaeota archaeon]|jgi:hypothetical protein|nr:hypothetical protein [Candidatus Woesearchaeota archaeon]MBT7403054.1 hypothetical protein [Candidatus Woesearchaeota archaeon]